METRFFRPIFVPLLLLFLLGGCLPGSDKGSSKLRSAISASPSASGTPTAGTDTDLFWYSGTINAGKTLIVNANTKTNVLLRGTKIGGYLSSTYSPTYSDSSAFFCMVITFNVASSGGKNQLRVRAIPDTFKNPGSKDVERLFRIDFEQSSLNQATCTGTVNSVTTTNAAYSPLTVCPNCTRNFASNVNSIKIYAVQNNSISDTSVVKSTYLDTTLLNLRIDGSNSTTDANNSICTPGKCESLGYDCCVEGQCVNKGQLRANASSFSEYAQAQADVGKNFSHYTLYPNIYYSCPGALLPTPGATPTGDLSEEAQARFKLHKQYYLCLQDTAKCIDPIPAPQTQANVDSLVQKLCGCTNTTNPSVYCNKFTLEAIYPTSILEENRTDNDIIQIQCKTVNLNAEPTPFQILSQNVSSRSAPHRFFKTNGDEVENILTLKGTPETDTYSVQEGSKFQYLNASSPEGLTFNMNSILGSMSISMTNALPAQVVKVQYDQSYIIGKTEGFYTPCRECAVDSWFKELKSHPESRNGTGLQAVGYSTTRDNYGSNLTYGNYEDTHFGRACYIPPTMIPWTHIKYSGVQDQRLSRLKTQAALYINGYQKDWYGFNYGALIGSFDGVSWFAIGKSRRVRATSNRLYLAINAPFADLAEVTNMQVHIYEDRGGNTASDYDYDPNLSRNDARQNEAGSCQYFHKCETDKDCITNLGWEYTCAETYSLKTNWPVFDQSAKEKANSSDTKNFSEILHSKSLPAGDTKRCVYRGNGAPCITDYTTLSKSIQKAYSCAPNFYCAKLNDAVFNQELVRTVNTLGSMLFGMDANVLGRPKNYVLANSTLPTSDVIAALKLNATTQSATFDNSKMGLCRPGKAIDNSITGNAYVDFHQNANSSRITDYISQIGGCAIEPTPVVGTENKPVFALRKVVSCPAVDPTGNYFAYTKSSVATPTVTEQAYFLTQNSCGAEAIKPTPSSPRQVFSDILTGTITSNSTVIDMPKLVTNACFRRAGSICHSDYDCTPNKLHADKAMLLTQNNFGNVAEHNYWKEYLVCAQAKDVPFTTAEDYNSYNLNENRCCRANGETLTMYSGKSGSGVNPENFPAYNMQSVTKYSRYTVNSDLWIDPNGGTVLNRAYATATASMAIASGKSPKPSFPIGTTDYFATPAATPDIAALAPFQWKTINDTGNKSCCGTWIRKFADGTHVWKDHYKKLNFSIPSFKCLNYSNVLPLDMLSNTTYLPASLSTWADNSPRYYPELSSMCILQNPASTAGGVCSQAPIASGVPGGGLQPPILNVVGTASIDTYFHTYANNKTSYTQNLNNFVPYFLKPANITGITKTYSEFAVAETKNRLDVYLPPYIDGLRNITEMSLVIACDNGNTELSKLPMISVSNPSSVMNNDNAGCFKWNYFGNSSDRPGLLSVARKDAGNTDCFANSSSACPTPTTDVTLVKMKYDGATKSGCNQDIAAMIAGSCNADQTLAAFLRIVFFKIGHPDHILSDGTTLAGSITNGSAAVNYTIGSAPGSDIYYEDKLSRFELTGIPQVMFEPLYCNSNHAELVPNLFKATSPALKMRSDVQLDQATCNYNNKFFSDPYVKTNLISGKSDPTNGPACVTNSDNVALPAQFSASEFVCCVPLGTKAASDDKCCSSFRDKSGICKLPSKTDLYLYLNKFVSGEGMEKKDMPGGGLKDSEFDPRTGYPKLTNDVYNKITAFGAAYCETGGTRMGGAFGRFAGEPKHPTAKQLETPPYSIIDSYFDEDTTSGQVDTGNARPDPTGFATFLDGYRWVSHVYCK